MSYISMPNIGEIGNLGSQIQQYFSIESIAVINNKIIVFPEISDKILHGLKFARLFNIPINIIPDSDLSYFVPTVVDENLLVDNKVFNLDNQTNYAFITRFDLYHYWYSHIKDRVDNVCFQDHIIKESTQILQNIKNARTTIGIHVRRGDYLLPQHSHFVELGIDYYENAINALDIDKTDYQILIFSNDMDWCRNNLSHLHNNITYIEDNTDFIDLCLMSLCDHNIIANSSFSWWAAYLNKNLNKQIICPRNYLQNHYLSKIINGNYYPPSWKAINDIAIRS